MDLHTKTVVDYDSARFGVFFYLPFVRVEVLGVGVAGCNLCGRGGNTVGFERAFCTTGFIMLPVLQT